MLGGSELAIRLRCKVLMMEGWKRTRMLMKIWSPRKIFECPGIRSVDKIVVDGM